MARHGISSLKPPLILAIENSTMCGSVAIVSPDICLAELSITSPTTHSRRLLGAIDTVLENASLKIEDVDAIAISLGPGSFTGIRIGLTTAKGLAFATQKPLIGINTLDALAAQVGMTSSLICAMLDARKKEVFAAFYTTSSAQQLDRCSELLSVPIASIYQTISEPVLFVGDGSLLYKTELQDSLGLMASFAPHEICYPRASAVGMLAIGQWHSNNFLNPASASPSYVRPSDAEICYKKKK
nr:tRNA (adenosine(37)-N6)-threonylcarbamoyltransferase complex dimerization subunit type 1 TsaB [Desulfobulbaceae bacterium]